MKNKKSRDRFLIGILVLIASTAVLTARTVRNPFNFLGRKRTAQPTRENRPQSTSVITSGATRNLTMQPQAFQMARRLGHRFAPNTLNRSVITGTLTLGSNYQAIQIVRAQTNTGESIGLQLAGRQDALSWDAATGALAATAPAVGIDRELIERLVFDTPDQFVLAQLRGASYYMVAHNIRPPNVDDNYAGPVWDIVRITDPEPDQQKQPLSRWRLYYLNTRSGLIDKIESEVAGQRVFAEIFSWTEVNGEKLPAQIRWTSNGQLLMQYSLLTFSRAAN